MEIIDAVGNLITLSRPAKRIVSLFPSQTHLLWSLGLDEEVIGITRFCKYPPHWKKQKTLIGGTKDVKIDRIAALQPDLILANKEENTKEAVEQLRQIAPVYVSAVTTWDDNLRFIKETGLLTGKTAEADNWMDKLTKRRREYEAGRRHHPKTALYFIWRNPWMTAGHNTFINTMLRLAGYKNLTPPEKGRYPAWDEEELRQIQPDTVLLCDEPFPFKPGKHYDEIRQLFPDAEILFVKGEPFTWFGTYPFQAFDYFEEIHKH